MLIVASTFKQSRVAFAHALAFMRPIIAQNPGRWRVLDSEQSALIEDRRTGATLEAREATPGSLHGPAPVLVIADEPAQWKATQGDRMLGLPGFVWMRGPEVAGSGAARLRWSHA